MSTNTGTADNISNRTATGAALLAQDCSPNPTTARGAETITRQEAYDIYETQTRFLLGKVLTVVDAAFSDKEQRKAVKDLVKQQFREQQKWVCEIFTESHLICTAGEEMKPV